LPCLSAVSVNIAVRHHHNILLHLFVENSMTVDKRSSTNSQQGRTFTQVALQSVESVVGILVLILRFSPACFYFIFAMVNKDFFSKNLLLVLQKRLY